MVTTSGSQIIASTNSSVRNNYCRVHANTFVDQIFGLFASEWRVLYTIVRQICRILAAIAPRRYVNGDKLPCQVTEALFTLGKALLGLPREIMRLLIAWKLLTESDPKKGAREKKF